VQRPQRSPALAGEAPWARRRSPARTAACGRGRLRRAGSRPGRRAPRPGASAARRRSAGRTAAPTYIFDARAHINTPVLATLAWP
jgi:hypothetical protein